MKLIFFIFSMLIACATSAQKTLAQGAIMQDYHIFKNILTTGHPSLYDYTPKAKWDSLWNHFETHEIHHLRTSNDLFKAISGLADQAKDGHLIIHHPTMDTIPAMFPVLIKIIDGKFYADTDEFDIPAGSEIISIDNIGGKEILQQMLKYAPSDGNSLHKKYRQIESEFGILHFYEYGKKKNYTVTYTTPDGISQTSNIESQSFERIGKRNAGRNSHFAAYHHHPNKAGHFENSINQKWPFVYYLDSIKTAVLTVNSFGLDPKEFKNQLIGLFNEMKKQNVEHLIIDIRQNIGGYRINAIHLYSFLTTKPFQQILDESAITSVLPEKDYVIHTMSDYGEFFKNYFASAQKENDRWILRKDHASNEMIPYEKTIKVEVYVLIGGKTFSAGSAFALDAKNSSNITLVGEETGGGYYFHTGQYPALYELPNSKIMVRMSLVKINHFVMDPSTPKGSGVLPDVEVGLTPLSLVYGEDSQLDYIIKRIKKDKWK